MKIHPSFKHLIIKNLFLPIVILILIYIGLISILPNELGVKVILYSIPIIFLLFLIVLTYLYIYSKNTSIYLEEDKLIFERGILKKDRKWIPLEKIDETLIKQNFIDRIIGGAELYVDTSGQEGYEIVVSDLNYNKLKELNDEIYKKLHHLNKK